MTDEANASTPTARPPRDELVRALGGGLELRDGTDGGGPPTMVGHFARFNEWTEIDSVFEGNFMERIAPGAFKKTFAENADRMRVLFQHGQDPQVGDKPLGPISVLEEDKIGARYEVPLLDAPYVREAILPGLKAGLYGASFRFSVQREEFNRDAKPSAHNPSGLPERTLKELAVREFGPCTFPAYAGATADVRSLTDEYTLAKLRTAGVHMVIADADEERFDNEDISTLAQMIQLGTVYIDEQDEPGDEANVPVMEDVLKTLASLVPYEVAEDEGAEPEDEGMASDGRTIATINRIEAELESAPPPDAAPDMGTSERDAAHVSTPWPKSPPDVWEGLWSP